MREATGCEAVSGGSMRLCAGTICQPGSSVVCGLVGACGVGGTNGCGWKSGTLGVDACTLGGVASFVGEGEA